MTYAEILENYLIEKGSFTHRDISLVTNGNCSYSILRDLKKLLEKKGKFLLEYWDSNPNSNKRFKRYTTQLA